MSTSDGKFCGKCGSELKEYKGLFEVGMACFNENCGKEPIKAEIKKSVDIYSEAVDPSDFYGIPMQFWDDGGKLVIDDHDLLDSLRYAFDFAKKRGSK